MRDLLASDAPAAATALDVFVYRAGRELGSLAAALGGLDAIRVHGRHRRNQREIRARICRNAEWLGVELDEAANARHGPRISTPQSRVLAFVVPTDEESMIARQRRHPLGEA